MLYSWVSLPTESTQLCATDPVVDPPRHIPGRHIRGEFVGAESFFKKLAFHVPLHCLPAPSSRYVDFDPGGVFHHPRELDGSASSCTFGIHFSRALMQANYIQFLMLIFPSKLERSLIFWMLGPMALVQAGMFFADFARFNDFKTIDLADALVNICDASLALLYTSGLLIWGGFVNWRRAWRTDGSTAAFGISVLVVAVCKTVVSFVHIAYDRAYWIRLLSATFTNWQCWLGFWWWVSAGMGIGEYEDRMRARRKKHALPTKKSRAKKRRSVSHTEAPRLSSDTAMRHPSEVGTGEIPSCLAAVSDQSPSVSNTDSAPFTVRLLRNLLSSAPLTIRRRYEHLRNTHNRAIRDAALSQASVYARVMLPANVSFVAGSDLMRRLLLKDRTVYD